MTRMTVPASGATAPAAWVDHGVVPPQRLPSEPAAIAAYLSEALGHPVHERWTWTRLIKVYGALPDARRAKPTVCRLLIDARSRGGLAARTATRAPERRGGVGRVGRAGPVEQPCQALQGRADGRERLL